MHNYDLRAGSPARPVLSILIGETYNTFAPSKEPVWSAAYFHTGRVVFDPAAAFTFGRSRECRDYILTGQGPPDAKDEADGTRDKNVCYGLPRRMYGLPLYVSECQPEGTVDVWFGDECLTVDGVH